MHGKWERVCKQQNTVEWLIIYQYVRCLTMFLVGDSQIGHIKECHLALSLTYGFHPQLIIHMSVKLRACGTDSLKLFT
jgi:hypothetical protein